MKLPAAPSASTALLALALVACDSAVPGEVAAPGVMPPEVGELLGPLAPALAVTPSAGCGLDPSVTAGQPTSVAFSSATARDGSYALYLPNTYDKNHPTALVVGLHGWTSNGSSGLRGSGSDNSADALGYIAAWPDGVPFGFKTGDSALTIA